jgi:probable lipoprotein NlpC
MLAGLASCSIHREPGAKGWGFVRPDHDQIALQKEYLKQEKELKKQERALRKQKPESRNLATSKTSKNLDKDVEKVIKTARSYYGTPYRYGGTSRIGMDCSGLLCTSFKAINVDLPRTSQEQSQFGQTIREKEIREGDLLFFGTGGSRSINHVGLVTEVKPDGIIFIHSSTSLGVIEDNLNADYYRRSFIKAVRPRI